MESLSGKLLVAARRLDDPNFRRTVVLVIHHEPAGAFGAVLNRPAAERLPEVWERTVEQPCSLDIPLHIGGPVEGPLMALHADPPRSEQEVVPGVHFSRLRDHLVALVSEASLPLRVLAGYSGWGGGQLEGEITRGDWGVASATAEIVFGATAGMWELVSRRAADEALVAGLRIRNVPHEPWHN